MGPDRRLLTRVAGPLLLAGLVAAVYAPVGGYPFLPLDDPDYVTNNHVVNRGLSLEGIAWAFGTFHASNWHPLTWLSHMADVTLFGLDPGPPHLVNAAIHAANTLLLYALLLATTGASGRSAVVSALFAVHPLHIESVAWVAERKDLLCAFFFLLSLVAYVRYVKAPATGRYLAVAAFQALALLSKPMAVTLPLVLLLLDVWPLRRTGPAPDGTPEPGGGSRRIRGLLAEKIPFAVLSAASCAVTLAAQWRGGSVDPLEALPLPARLANAFLSYAAYLGKAAWPASLAVFYPHPWHAPGGFPWGLSALSVLAFAALTALSILARKRLPGLFTGWGWYVVTLLPVIGLVQVGSQGMADRYAYLPLIGAFVAAAWGVPALLGEGRRALAAAAALGAAVVAVMAVVARLQLSFWEDPERLFGRALAVTENNATAHVALGAALLHQGRPAEAEARFREAARIRPDDPEAHGFLGMALLMQSRNPEAEGELRKALSLNPAEPTALQNLGVALMSRGSHEEALSRLRDALKVDPHAPTVHYNIGVALTILGRPSEAVAAYREAVRLRPSYARAHNNLGDLLLRSGRDGEAIAHFREALRLAPDDPVALGNLLKATGGLAAPGPPGGAGRPGTPGGGDR